MGGATDKLGDTQFKIIVVEALRAVKSRYSYRALARLLGVNHTLLARYVSGALLPSTRQARKIWEGLRGIISVRDLILSELEAGGVLDLAHVLSDPLYLRVITLEFMERFGGDAVDKILVPETSGITLATSLALAFNVPLIIARRRKANPRIRYVEASASLAPSIVRIFYVPEGSLTPGERVLVVDDIIQSGLTLETMRRLVEASGATLAGVAAVIVYGNAWRARVKLPRGTRVEAILELEPGEPVA